jgi:hypothetical protein
MQYYHALEAFVSKKHNINTFKNIGESLTQYVLDPT